MAIRPDGTTPDTLEEQADQVYANIVAALAAKNAPPSAIIQLTTFMVDDDPNGVIRTARQKHLGDHRPASTAVYVTRLIDRAWKVEIEAVAIIPDAQ